MLTYANLKRYFMIKSGKEWVDAFCHRVGLAPMGDESQTLGLVFYLVSMGQGASATDDKLQVVVDRGQAIALAHGILAMAEQNKWPIPEADKLQMHRHGGQDN